jgi:hypothetical protein
LEETAMAGYSGKQLWEKLGVKPGMSLAVLNAPPDYAGLLGDDLPPDVLLENKIGQKAPLVHLFVKDMAELEEILPLSRDKLASDGALWVSWYKKSAKIPTDVDENRVRDLALQSGLVDVKVCAVSEIWSGLKLVYRLKDRKP